MRPDESKIVLQGPGPDPVWTALYEQYGRHDPVRLKRLAMLALREESGWPLEWIGDVFSHHKGHISRSLKQTRDELRQQFDVNPSRNTASSWHRRSLTHDGSPQQRGPVRNPKT